jgi:hypothetical protein
MLTARRTHVDVFDDVDRKLRESRELIRRFDHLTTRMLGRRAEAITTLAKAIALMEKFPLSAYRQAHTLEVLAASLSEEDRTGESRRAYARATEVFEAIGGTEASRRCRNLATAVRDTSMVG